MKPKKEIKGDASAPEFGKCKKCGIIFVPIWLDALGKFATCCGTCGLRNILTYITVHDPKGEK